MNNQIDWTQKIVDFILDTRFEDIPAEAVQNAKGRVLDSIGVSFPGWKEPHGKVLTEYIEDVGGNPQASIIQYGKKVDAVNAAFINGTLMHAIDYDDHFILSHSTVCILPAALAVAEKVGATGEETLAAYIIGNEVYTKIQQVTTTEPWYRGFHGTGIWGSLGAVAAAGRLLKLDKQQMRMAFGIACSSFSGLKRNMGTMTKPYHAGRAAEAGVRAAILAKYGFTSHPEAFEGNFGYIQTFCSDPQWQFLDQLGKRWDYVVRPCWIKPHPSCGGTHSAMNGMMELLHEYPQIVEENVERIDVGMNQGGVDSLYYPDPQTIFEAKFSMQFCIALVLHYRRWGLTLHTMEVINDPEMRALYPKIHLYVDEALDKEIPRDFTDDHAIVKVTMKDGTVYTKRATLAKLSIEQIKEKFFDCTSLVIEKDRSERIADQVLNLEKQADINALMTDLRG